VWTCYSHSPNQWFGLIQERATFTSFNSRLLVAVSSDVFSFASSSSNSNEQWIVNNLDNTIKSNKYGTCLDAYQPQNGGAVHLFACDGSNKNQLWHFDDSTGQLRHLTHQGYCLDMGSDNGNIPQLWQCHTSDDLYFKYQKYSYKALDF